MSTELLLGIDLGGTNIKAVWTDASGAVQRRETVPTPEHGEGWKLAVDGLAAGHRGPIGLAAPGLANREGTQISHMPGRLEGLENFDWSGQLNLPVRVLNDAHAALLGELWQGAGRGRRHVVMLTLGTGVGGALLADGRLLRGAIGRAGHLGHISLDPAGRPDIAGTPGSLEDAIGDCTVAARTGFATTRALVEAARAGNAAAQGHWETSVRALAAALASLINAFDPEVIVLGGGMIAAGDALFVPLEKFMDHMEWRPAGHRVPILPAQLAEWSGALGAACYAFYGEEPRVP